MFIAKCTFILDLEHLHKEKINSEGPKALDKNGRP